LPFDLYTLQESFQIVRGSGVFKEEGEKGEGEEGEEGEGEEGGEGVLAVAAPSACCCIEILNSEL